VLELSFLHVTPKCDTNYRCRGSIIIVYRLCSCTFAAFYLCSNINAVTVVNESWGSMVTIVTVLWAKGPGIQILARARDFTVLCNIPTSSDAYWAAYCMSSSVCLFVCFHGLPRQVTDVLQPAGLLYRPLWTFQLWPLDAPSPTDAFRTLAAEVGTYGRGKKDR
jgi:hypothetical protein